MDGISMSYTVSGAFSNFHKNIVNLDSEKTKKAQASFSNIINIDNEIIPVFVYSVPIFDKNGNILRSYVAIRDRREEIQKIKKQTEPIITVLNNISNNDLSKQLHLEDDKLYLFQNPLSDTNLYR